MCRILLLICAATGVFGRADIYDVTLNGEYYWELLFDIDNTGNVGSIKREVSVTTVVFCSYESMLRSLETTTTSASMGVNLGGTLLEVINIGVSGELSHEVKSEYEKMSRTQKSYRSTTTKTDTYEVGGNSRLKLYRLGFKGPGVSYMTDTLVTRPVNKPVVPINFKVKQLCPRGYRSSVHR